MNSIAKAALVGVAALAVFVSCGRDEIDVVEEVSTVRTVKFTAGMVDTKAQFGEQEGDSWPTLWTANDSQLKLSLNYATAIAAGITPSADYRSATFSANIDFANFSAPYTYYAVSPASAAQALSPSREAWKVTIPCEQTPTAGSVDEAGIIIAASSYAFPDEVSASEVNLQFQHLTAYGCMSLDNLELHSGESVQAVEITTTTPIVGDWYWNTSGAEITDYGASSTLTLNTSSISGIWFACAPVSVGDEILTVNVFTNLGVFKKMTLFPDGCKFESGQAAIFTVDMDGAGFTAAGSGSGSSDVVVLSEEFDNNTTSDSSTEFSSSKFSNFSGSTSKAYTSQYGGVKLGSSSSSGYITSKSLDLSSSFTVTLNVLKYGSDTGKVQVTVGSVTKEITPTSTDTAYSLDFDAATSASTVKIGTSTKRAYIDNVIITRHDSGSGGGSSTEDALLQESEYGCYLGTSLTWALNAGTEQVTRLYDTNGVQTYTLIDSSEVEELEIVGYKKTFVKGDSFTVYVHWRQGTTVVHSGTYAVTLIKEAGPKVWLSTGNGEGFIIKK
jgi:hypothetical protein